MSKDLILVPLLEGFEEIEAVTILDVLRRADLRVVIGGDAPGLVRGAHGISINAEVALAEIQAADLRAIVLPGGMPGARNLAEHPRVQRLIRDVATAGGTMAAICAAPIALAAAGVHEGRTITCYPGFQEQLAGGKVVDDRVVVDGKVVTSRGPGTALEFALTLVGLLGGSEREQQVAADTLLARPEPALVVG